MVNMDTEKLMMQKRIDNLCEQLELVKRQRDAAIAALDEIRHCDCCKHYKKKGSEEPCYSCDMLRKTNYEWRRLCEENGGAEDESMR